MADLRLNVRDRCAGLEHQRDERAAERVRGHENPDEVARALLLMNTAVFVERLGKVPPDSPESGAPTLAQIWSRALIRRS